ncbi:AraC family transcriptional regulator [[Clostridium] innocuum]|nr:AraC family transcriptional regulator [Erysipelotrichaceae bacterium]MCR0383653.1 AraC family transcriptional regulator [[Clostridium] innocuum]MCR0413047.1 AraC family transcriptional regulator [[Clostridium] innocuum]MCR0534157.1 AraC family transcriptional regulator [[Clostridium] innocuum]MCR0539050.1 AraC family transcriptional regulator [[Clostridium] innocuum]
MNRSILVNQVIDYILQHMDEDLTLSTLAAQCFVSKYYLAHMFKEETGEALYSFIKRCRIDQSAVDLKLQPTKSITDIGLDYGYSASNFSSVFKNRHAVSPSCFRKNLPSHSIPIPFSPEKIIHFQTAEEYAAAIEIKEFEDQYIIYERFIGSYLYIEENWYRFIDAHKAPLKTSAFLIERFYNDPTISSPSHCICDLCMVVDPADALEGLACIKGGKWAVYHYTGEIKNIFEAMQGVFTIWLPQSGYTMTRHYGLNIYHRINRSHHSVVMDLCIPIE